jgi:hypothetical protein
MDFVVVQTYVVVLIFGVILPFVNIFSFSPMQVVQYTSKSFHDNNKYTTWLGHLQICDQTKMFPIVDYLIWASSLISSISLK